MSSLSYAGSNAPPILPTYKVNNAASGSGSSSSAAANAANARKKRGLYNLVTLVILIILPLSLLLVFFVSIYIGSSFLTSHIENENMAGGFLNIGLPNTRNVIQKWSIKNLRGIDITQLGPPAIAHGAKNTTWFQGHGPDSSVSGGFGGVAKRRRAGYALPMDAIRGFAQGHASVRPPVVPEPPLAGLSDAPASGTAVPGDAAAVDPSEHVSQHQQLADEIRKKLEGDTGDVPTDTLALGDRRQALEDGGNSQSLDGTEPPLDVGSLDLGGADATSPDASSFEELNERDPNDGAVDGQMPLSGFDKSYGSATEEDAIDTGGGEGGDDPTVGGTEEEQP